MCEYIMYLRKSRADNPDETVEEVLSKHYNILQDFCLRELGYRIPEENIYREVVSGGESIDDRIEIKKVLAELEKSSIKGCVVLEPQRLSRGSLSDCGRLIDTFLFSNSLVVTPMMTYNMKNKMERRFFQDELMRGRDYLEYTKEILMRGREAAVKRGCYIQSSAPYGYDKIRIGKDYTLTPNDKADTIRLIFDMYSKGSSPHEIQTELYRLGIASPSGKDKWTKPTIKKVLHNHHYIGKVTFHKRRDTIQVIDGEKVKRRLHSNDFLIADGKHPAIIDKEVFNKVQDRLLKNPPMKADKQLRNIFSGMLYCARCGSAIQYKRSHKKIYYVCNTVGCSPSTDIHVFEDTVLQVLEKTELPNLMAKFKNGDGSSIELQKKMLKTLEKELATLKAQEETQYELLETKKYTQEVFDKRNKIVREKMEKVSEQITEAKKSLPNAIDYKERIATLKEAIESMKNPSIPVKEKNRLLKSIIERIDVKSYPTEKEREYKFDLKVTLRI